MLTRKAKSGSADIQMRGNGDLTLRTLVSGLFCAHPAPPDGRELNTYYILKAKLHTKLYI
jgi:hypothetical protein